MSWLEEKTSLVDLRPRQENAKCLRLDRQHLPALRSENSRSRTSMSEKRKTKDLFPIINIHNPT
jgi:hypothetical protein